MLKLPTSCRAGFAKLAANSAKPSGRDAPFGTGNKFRNGCMPAVAPAREEIEGTSVMPTIGWRKRIPSYHAKKNVWSLLIGPPNVAPKEFKLFAGCVRPRLLANQSFASSASLPKKWKREP